MQVTNPMPFTLLDQHGLPRQPTAAERLALGHLFPGHRGLFVFGPFLVVTMEALPRDPWPMRIAGLPLYLTCSEFEVPWDLGTPGNPRVLALEQHNAKFRGARELYTTVIRYFNDIKINVQELTWIASSWRVRISDMPAEMLQGLPGRLCQIAVFYLFEEPADLPQAFVHRETIDDSPYTDLRPGVMIASESLTTTSGVFVSNSSGERYITVASHGFPSGQSDVHHPRETDPVIGRVENQIQDTDIGLVRLASGINYVNEIFASDVEPAGISLRGYKDPYDLDPYTLLSMDTPFTGTTDAMFLTVSVRRVPSDSDHENTWISKTWSWLGQCHPPTDGCCGAAIWDAHGLVVGFFRFLLIENPGIGVGVAAEELAVRGCRLLCQ